MEHKGHEMMSCDEFADEVLGGSLSTVLDFDQETLEWTGVRGYTLELLWSTESFDFVYFCYLKGDLRQPQRIEYSSPLHFEIPSVCTRAEAAVYLGETQDCILDPDEHVTHTRSPLSCGEVGYYREMKCLHPAVRRILDACSGVLPFATILEDPGVNFAEILPDAGREIRYAIKDEMDRMGELLAGWEHPL